jgi:hypothetical protein
MRVVVLPAFVLPRLRMDGLYRYYPHGNVSPALRAVIDTLKI